MTGYVSEMQLYLGGNLVKEYQDTPDNPQNPHQTSATLSVVFDSSYFSDGTALPIEAVITDSAGNEYNGQITGPIYNKAYVLGNQNMDTDFGQVSSDGLLAEADMYAQALASYQDPTGSTVDDKDTMLGNLPTYTDFYIYTHGYSDPDTGLFWILDCIGFDDSPDAFWLFSQDDPTEDQSVQDAVAAKSQQQPAYNLVHPDCCRSAENETMANAFGIGDGSVDRAYLGWTMHPPDSFVWVNWSNVVWQDLFNGWTLQDAVAHAITVVGVGEGEYVIIGDKNMTLHATAYGAALQQWYR